MKLFFSSRSLVKALVGCLVIGALVSFAVWFFGPFGPIDQGKYQAVFLSNGQVYFGKLRGLHSDFPVMNDVYYLIVTKPIQSQEDVQNPKTETEFSLKKLGSEIHGPEDKMIINQKHILFVENLKDSSKVVDTIHQLIKQTENQNDATNSTN